jgi:hypothetical protein
VLDGKLGKLCFWYPSFYVLHDNPIYMGVGEKADQPPDNSKGQHNALHIFAEKIQF